MHEFSLVPQNLSPINMVGAVGYAPGHLGLTLLGAPVSSEPIGLFGCGKMYLKGTLRDEKQGEVLNNVVAPPGKWMLVFHRY